MATTVPIPASLSWMKDVPEANRWLAGLPDLVDRAAERWNLTIGRPFEGGYTSWVAPATISDGEMAVLKLQLPHRESRFEAAALRRWQGNGAVILIDHHPDDAALLVEHASPGHALSTEDTEMALDVVADLLPDLLVAPPAGMTTVADEAKRWRVSLESNAVRWPGALSHELVDATADFLDELADSSPARPVLVNQDLHGDNVIAGTRLPWLVIDPKPLSGDAAFAVAPVVRSPELGHSRQAVIRRLDRLVEIVGVERPTAARHTIAHTVAWGFGPHGPLETHMEVAEWLLSIVR